MIKGFLEIKPGETSMIDRQLHISDPASTNGILDRKPWGYIRSDTVQLQKNILKIF